MNIKKNEVFGRLIRSWINSMFANDLCEVYSVYDPKDGTLRVKSVVSVSSLVKVCHSQDAIEYAKRSLVKVLDFLTRDCPSINDPRIKEIELSEETKAFFPPDSYCAELTVKIED